MKDAQEAAEEYVSKDKHLIADAKQIFKDGVEWSRENELKIAVEALEYYGNKPTMVNFNGLDVQLCEGRESFGHKAREALAKIAGMK